MHLWGKIFTWMIIPAACAAIILTSKMVTYRNSWTKKIDELQKKNELQETDIAEAELKLRELRSSLARTLLGWDRVWHDQVPPISAAAQADGTIGLQNFGTLQGFGQVDPPPGGSLPLAHLFKPLGDDAAQYIGSFQVQDPGALRENSVEPWAHLAPLCA